MTVEGVYSCAEQDTPECLARGLDTAERLLVLGALTEALKLRSDDEAVSAGITAAVAEDAALSGPEAGKQPRKLQQIVQCVSQRACPEARRLIEL